MKYRIYFFISLRLNAIVCGDPYRIDSHEPDDEYEWRRAELTPYDDLVVTREAWDLDGDIEMYEDVVFSKCTTRAELCRELSPSTCVWGNTHHFDENGYIEN